MQFVLYYAMTQRYFQMFFGVQENLIFLQQFLNFLNEREEEKEEKKKNLLVRQ